MTAPAERVLSGYQLKQTLRQKGEGHKASDKEENSKGYNNYQRRPSEAPGFLVTSGISPEERRDDVDNRNSQKKQANQVTGKYRVVV
jgi:hypothetical protein